MDAVDQVDGESCCSSSLSNHSQYMRDALHECSELLVEQLRELHLSLDIEHRREIQQLFHSARLSCGKIEQEREAALQRLHETSKLDIAVHMDNGQEWLAQKRRQGKQQSDVALQV